jgi:hypothetical protein
VPSDRSLRIVMAIVAIVVVAGLILGSIRYAL